MSGIHLGHDGKKYFSTKIRDEADRAYAKANPKGNGKARRWDRDKTPNRRGSPAWGGEYTAAEWKEWKEAWYTPRGAAAAPKQPAGEQPAVEWIAPGSEPPTAEAPSAEAPPEVSRRLADGRFAYTTTDDAAWEGVACLQCHTD